MGKHSLPEKASTSKEAKKDHTESGYNPHLSNSSPPFPKAKMRQQKNGQEQQQLEVKINGRPRSKSDKGPSRSKSERIAELIFPNGADKQFDESCVFVVTISINLGKEYPYHKRDSLLMYLRAIKKILDEKGLSYEDHIRFVIVDSVQRHNARLMSYYGKKGESDQIGKKQVLEALNKYKRGQKIVNVKEEQLFEERAKKKGSKYFKDKKGELWELFDKITHKTFKEKMVIYWDEYLQCPEFSKEQEKLLDLLKKEQSLDKEQFLRTKQLLKSEIIENQENQEEKIENIKGKGKQVEAVNIGNKNFISFTQALEYTSGMHLQKPIGNLSRIITNAGIKESELPLTKKQLIKDFFKPNVMAFCLEEVVVLGMIGKGFTEKSVIAKKGEGETTLKTVKKKENFNKAFIVYPGSKDNKMGPINHVMGYYLKKYNEVNKGIVLVKVKFPSAKHSDTKKVRWGEPKQQAQVKQKSTQIVIKPLDLSAKNKAPASRKPPSPKEQQAQTQQKVVLALLEMQIVKRKREAAQKEREAAKQEREAAEQEQTLLKKIGKLSGDACVCIPTSFLTQVLGFPQSSECPKEGFIRMGFFASSFPLTESSPVTSTNKLNSTAHSNNTQKTFTTNG